MPPDHRQTVIQVGFSKKVLTWPLNVCAAILRLFNRLFIKRQRGKRLVVFEPYGMGDLITLEPLLRQLRAAGFETVLSSQERWRGIFSERQVSEWINSDLPWVSYTSKEKYKLRRLFNQRTRSFLSRLRQTAKGRPGFDPRGDVRSVIILYLAGCTPVYSLDCYRGSDIHVPSIAARLIPFDHERRHWEINLGFGEALGLKMDASRGPDLDHFGAPASTSRKIGIVNTAPWVGRYWQAEKWQAVVNALRGEDWEIEGLCGPGQDTDTRVQLGDSVPVRVNSSLAAWAEGLLQLRCLITLDSGPMHLADALGVPVVALFGPGKLPLWAPSHPRSALVHHQDDADFQVCHQIEINVPIGKRSMERISVEEVLQATRTVLQ